MRPRGRPTTSQRLSCSLACLAARTRGGLAPAEMGVNTPKDGTTQSSQGTAGLGVSVCVRLFRVRGGKIAHPGIFGVEI